MGRLPSWGAQGLGVGLTWRPETKAAALRALESATPW